MYISKNSLKCDLIKPLHTSTLCQSVLHEKKSAVFLDVVGFCFAFANAAMNCVYQQPTIFLERVAGVEFGISV